MQFHFKKISFALIISALIMAASFGVVTKAQYNSPIGPSQTPGQTLSGQTLNSQTDVTAPYTLLEPLPCPNGLGAACTGTSNGSEALTSISLSQFISYAYKFMIALAVVLAVFMITVGGFEYMLSGATGKKSDAIKKIQDAVAGLILALVAYLVLYTIDPNLVSQNNLSIPPISSSNTTSSSQNSTASAAATNNQVPNNVNGLSGN